MTRSARHSPPVALSRTPSAGARSGCAALAAAALWAAPAAASVCQSVAMDLPGASYVRVAALEAGTATDAAPLPAATPELTGEVTIRFVGHSTYLLETGGGVVIATDYAGWSGGVLPRVVTMNHAHETHWTAFPDERIDHVFRGWNPDGDGPARHHEKVGDTLIRNVATDIRSWGGGVEPFGNSIFVFEIGDLCVGHLGHLHHELTDDHYAAIGRLDVVMAAVDGGVTLNLPDMIALLKRVRASVVLPMHYWAYGSLQRFLDGMADDFRIITAETPAITITPRTLPRAPSVYVLPQVSGPGFDD